MNQLLRGMVNRLSRVRLALARRRSASPPTTGIRLSVKGESWLAALLSPDCEVVTEDPTLVLVGPGAGDDAPSPGDRHPHPVVYYRSDGEPRLDRSFVQPRMANPITLEVPDGVPDDLVALASAAAYRTVDSGPNGDDSRHRRYREAHQQSSLRFLDEVLQEAGLPGHGLDQEVTVVCVTNRPRNLGNVISNFQRQLHPGKRLLLLTNSSDFDPDEVESRLAATEGAVTIDLPEHWSLGACLNHAIERCETRFMAKFDDDDQYGGHYLGDALAAHRYARSGVVGKHSHYVRVEASGETHLRFPGREFEYTSFVAGGTLVVDLEAIGSVRFPDLSVGEDSAFIRRCQSSGVDVFSADRFNYLQHRTGSNTWELDVDELRRTSTPAADADVFI